MRLDATVAANGHGIVLAVAVALAGLGAGFVLGRIGRGALSRQAERAQAELARSEAQGREHQRQLTRLRNEQRALSNLSRFLPNVVRDLNRSDLESRAIPRLVFQLVDSIFEPEQILLYLVRSPGEESEQAHEIFLVEHTGLAEVPAALARIRVGDGKIGWVAEAKVEMLADDWLNLSRTEGRAVADNHPSGRFDLMAPLVHHEGDREQLLGVLCVGAPSVRPRDEKLMLQMVANLASIAIINARNVKRLSEQANHDGLTGLLNKRFFLGTRLGLLINHAEREAQRLGVFIFDIDFFKTYNDRNGHVAGDDVLRQVAKVLQDNLRPGDMACRYGGEEFVVAMPQTAGPEALRVADRIRHAMECHPFPHRETQPGGKVTISGGVSVFPFDGSNGTDLIKSADEALYKAKGAGRNRVFLFRGVELSDGADAEPWSADSPIVER